MHGVHAQKYHCNDGEEQVDIRLDKQAKMGGVVCRGRNTATAEKNRWSAGTPEWIPRDAAMAVVVRYHIVDNLRIVPSDLDTTQMILSLWQYGGRPVILFLWLCLCPRYPPRSFVLE